MSAKEQKVVENEVLTNYYWLEGDPLKPYSHWLPANPGSLPPSTAIRVRPDEKAGYWPILNKYGNGWDLVRDYRGQSIWNTKTQERAEVKKLGEIDKGWTFIEPPTSYHTWDGENWVLTQEAKDEIAEKDKANALAAQNYRIDAMTKECNDNIAALEDLEFAEDLGLPPMTEEEEAELKEWRKCRLMLRRLKRDVINPESAFPTLPNGKDFK